jgi:hypothetical protein
LRIAPICSTVEEAVAHCNGNSATLETTFDHGEASIMQASCKHHHVDHPTEQNRDLRRASDETVLTGCLAWLEQYIGVAIACHSHIDLGPLQLQCRHLHQDKSWVTPAPCLDQRQT